MTALHGSVSYGGGFGAAHGVCPPDAGDHARFMFSTIRGLSGTVQRMQTPLSIGRADFDGAAQRKD